MNTKKATFTLLTSLPLLVFQGNCDAQQKSTVSYTPPQDCNSLKDIYFKNKSPYEFLFLEHCERLRIDLKQNVARVYGRPQPSKRILSVPEHGSTESAKYGVSCINHLVMIKTKDGWVQALDGERRYYTCNL